MNLERNNYEKTNETRVPAGGSKRQEILDKAVKYIADPRFGFQGDKHHFLLNEVGLSESEYLTCLNRATLEAADAGLRE